MCSAVMAVASKNFTIAPWKDTTQCARMEHAPNVFPAIITLLTLQTAVNFLTNSPYLPHQLLPEHQSQPHSQPQ